MGWRGCHIYDTDALLPLISMSIKELAGKTVYGITCTLIILFVFGMVVLPKLVEHGSFMVELIAGAIGIARNLAASLL